MLFNFRDLKKALSILNMFLQVTYLRFELRELEKALLTLNIFL